jgi:hypothetical protein
LYGAGFEGVARVNSGVRFIGGLLRFARNDETTAKQPPDKPHWVFINISLFFHINKLSLPSQHYEVIQAVKSLLKDAYENYFCSGRSPQFHEDSPFLSGY